LQNFIRLAISQMQISFCQPPAECKFNSIAHHPDANFIQLAVSWMQIASG
jgi:hypothetical protein